MVIANLCRLKYCQNIPATQNTHQTHTRENVVKKNCLIPEFYEPVLLL